MTAFGSAPHHDRVLAVVLVTTAQDADERVRVVHLTPFTPEWDAFWHDIGRPEESTERTPKAPEPGECVQPACPTHGKGHVQWSGPVVNAWFCWAEGCGWETPAARPEPASDPEIEAPMRFVPGLEAHGRKPEPVSPRNGDLDTFLSRRHARRARLIAASQRLAARWDLLEQLGPLDHPYPEEGTT